MQDCICVTKICERERERRERKEGEKEGRRNGEERGGGEEEGRRRGGGGEEKGIINLVCRNYFHTRQQKFMIEFGQHSTVQSTSSHGMNVTIEFTRNVHTSNHMTLCQFSYWITSQWTA